MDFFFAFLATKFLTVVSIRKKVIFFPVYFAFSLMYVWSIKKIKIHISIENQPNFMQFKHKNTSITVLVYDKSLHF